MFVPSSSSEIIREDHTSLTPKFSYFSKFRNLRTDANRVEGIDSKANFELRKRLKPTLVVSELLGVCYFYERPVKKLIFITIYRIIVLALLVGCIAHEVPTIKYWMSKLTSFHSLLAFIETWSRWTILIINYLLNVKNNGKINKVVTLLVNVPVFLDRFVMKRIYLFQIFLILWNVILICGYMGIGHNVVWENDNYKWYTCIIYICTEFYLTLANIQFVGFLYVLREFYKLINLHLRKWNLREFRTLSLIMDSSYKLEDLFDIAKFRDLHLNLFSIGLNLNRCYSLQILFFIVLCMVEITYSLRSFMLFLVKNHEDESAEDWSKKPWLEVLLTIFWGGYYFSCLIQILSLCHFTTTESKNTSLIVHELINRVQDKDVEKQLQLFSLQLMNHSAIFTAGRFFRLDFAILHSIVGTITTYLVIIITFRD